MESSLFGTLLRLAAVLLLVLANGFFVAAEFALVSVRRTRIAELVDKGSRSARWAQLALEDTDKVIAATQLGITLASLGLGWIGEPALAGLVEPVVELFPPSIRPQASHGVAAGLSFAVITFLHVVIGELAPKSIALQNPERTSLIVAQPTIWTERLFTPAIWALNGAGNGLLRLLGFQAASGHEMVHSVEEIKMLVSASAESGIVENQKQEMVHAVFDMHETYVRQVMIPRTEVVAVEAGTNMAEVIEVLVANPFTKLPVYEGKLDDVIGILHSKDVVRALVDQRVEGMIARDLMRDAIFVPEAARADRLLEFFRSSHQHIAIVLDEYGGTAGVVTLEDLLEEIVGDVRAPIDTEAEIQPMPDGTTLVDGFMLIEEVNAHFGLNITDPHYDTIAGFIMGRLGRIAQVGDSLRIDSTLLRVEAMQGLRIEYVAILTAPDQPSGRAP
jgi:CBS domain containing-hemolysin-like protein